MRVKLEDVCERGSSNLRQSDIEGKTGAYPIYGAAGYIGQVDFYHQEKPYVAVVKDGAGIGRTTLLPAKSSVIGTMQYLLPKDNVLPEYLCYVVQYMHLEKYFTGATIPHIYFRDYKNEFFNLDSIDNQKVIVSILSKVEQIIECRERELKALDDLIKARFVEMFGDPNEDQIRWDEVSIGDHCFVTKLAGFEYTNYIHYEDSGDVVMVKAQNVKRGALNEKDLSYISNEVSDSLPRSQLAPGDVVMTYVGANIGDVAIIDDRHKYHLAPNVAKIRPDRSEYNSVFFMYMLMMKTDYIMRNSADTAKAALGMERIRRLKVFNPPLELQHKFAAFVAQVDKSKFAVQKALDKAQLLFDSLMQKYFG